MLFESHVVRLEKVENIKHNISTSSSLHKKAIDWVSFEGKDGISYTDTYTIKCQCGKEKPIFLTVLFKRIYMVKSILLFAMQLSSTWSMKEITR